MSQLTQALEVVKDLSQIKARLLKDKSELQSILYKAKHPEGLSDNSIDQETTHKLQVILYLLGNLIAALETI